MILGSRAPLITALVGKRDTELEKRRRDQLRRQKQQVKEERKAKRAAERADKASNPNKDSDLEGMVAGLQPGQILDVDAQ